MRPNGAIGRVKFRCACVEIQDTFGETMPFVTLSHRSKCNKTYRVEGPIKASLSVHCSSVTTPLGARFGPIAPMFVSRFPVPSPCPMQRIFDTPCARRQSPYHRFHSRRLPHHGGGPSQRHPHQACVWRKSSRVGFFLETLEPLARAPSPGLSLLIAPLIESAGRNCEPISSRGWTRYEQTRPILPGSITH